MSSHRVLDTVMSPPAQAPVTSEGFVALFLFDRARDVAHLAFEARQHDELESVKPPVGAGERASQVPLDELRLRDLGQEL